MHDEERYADRQGQRSKRHVSDAQVRISGAHEREVGDDERLPPRELRDVEICAGSIRPRAAEGRERLEARTILLDGDSSGGVSSGSDSCGQTRTYPLVLRRRPTAIGKRLVPSTVAILPSRTSFAALCNWDYVLAAPSRWGALGTNSLPGRHSRESRGRGRWPCASLRPHTQPR